MLLRQTIRNCPLTHEMHAMRIRNRLPRLVLKFARHFR